MKIRLELYASFRKYAPDHAVKGHFELELAQGSTIRDVLQQIGIARQPKLVLVNGEQERLLERKLTPGDSLALFPPVVGGSWGKIGHTVS